MDRAYTALDVQLEVPGHGIGGQELLVKNPVPAFGINQGLAEELQQMPLTLRQLLQDSTNSTVIGVHVDVVGRKAGT